MSRLTKLLIGVAAVVALFATAHAQVVPTNLWRPNYASSTIAPINSVLQVPCANVVGGCSSGGGATTTISGVSGPTFTISIVSTSSPSSITTSSANLFLNLLRYTSSSQITISSTGTITFASNNISQFTNNVPYLTSSTVSIGLNTIIDGGETVNGNVTSTSYYSSSTSNTNIQQVNTQQFIPSDYASDGCFGSSSTLDLGACANLSYNNVSSTQSSTVINVPNLPRISFSTPIVFANLGEYADLKCTPGTVLLYTGTGTALTLSEGDQGNVSHEDEGCTLEGGTTTATTATTTGIMVGGGNTNNMGGERALTLLNMSVKYFGTNIETASNTYMFTAQNVMNVGAASHEWVIQNAVNEGENMKLIGDTSGDPGNSSTSQCFYITGSGVSSLDMFGGSLDNCQLYVAAGNLTVNLYGVHQENPGQATYGAYTYIVEASSISTTINLFGGMEMDDATNTANSPVEYNAIGGTFNSYGESVDNNGGVSTAPVFADNSIDSTKALITVCNTQSQSTGFSSLINMGTATSSANIDSSAATGCFYGVPNAGVSGWSVLKNGAASGLESMDEYIDNADTFSTQMQSGGSALQTFAGLAADASTPKSTIDIGGSFGTRINVLDTTTSIPYLGGYGTYVQNSTATSTYTLPYAASTTGRIYQFKDRGTGSMIIAASTTNPSEFIWLSGSNASATTYTDAPGGSTAFQSDGTYWDQLWK